MAVSEKVSEKIVEGSFGLLKQWWFWLIIIVGGGLITGLIDSNTISNASDKAVEIIRALKGG